MSSEQDPQSQPDLLDSAHDGEDGWLVSYADLMTLLFGFFAMLFSFASMNGDKGEDVKVRKELIKYFGSNIIKASDNVKFTIVSDVAKALQMKSVNVVTKEDSIEINVLTNALFEVGKADMLPGSEDTLAHLGEVIKESPERRQIVVEAHCDDNPIHSSVFPSNWELSAARAATIVRLFEKSGVSPLQLGAVGYGDTRPAYPNRDNEGHPIPDNQALNRRVVIRVMLAKKD